MAVGAYSAARLSIRLDVGGVFGLVIVLIFGGIIGAISGVIIGIPALRLRGD
jgi:ABC-type branched-subunit amino acid transport system permease subunit